MVLKRIATLATALLLALLTVLGTAGTANAATTTFQLCNYGSDYTVQARFFERGKSTSLMRPGMCVQVSSRTGEAFHLVVRRTNNPALFGTTSDWTFSSGRTLVQTWANFNTFVYGKLPY